MEFPVSYSSFTVPTGAGIGESRTVLYQNGNLISYFYGPGQTSGKFVAMSQGQLFLGTANANNPSSEADFGDAASITAVFTGGSPELLFQSPTSGFFTNPVAMTLVTGEPGVHTPEVAIAAATSGSANTVTIGNSFSNALQVGKMNVTTVANQWVQANVTFATPFTAIPVISVLGQNGAPAVGGTTGLQYTATNVTTTGFTLGVMRGTAITMMIGWIAAIDQNS